MRHDPIQKSFKEVALHNFTTDGRRSNKTIAAETLFGFPNLPDHSWSPAFRNNPGQEAIIEQPKQFMLDIISQGFVDTSRNAVFARGGVLDILDRTVQLIKSDRFVPAPIRTAKIKRNVGRSAGATELLHESIDLLGVIKDFFSTILQKKLIWS